MTDFLPFGQHTHPTSHKSIVLLEEQPKMILGVPLVTAHILPKVVPTSPFEILCSRRAFQQMHLTGAYLAASFAFAARGAGKPRVTTARVATCQSSFSFTKIKGLHTRCKFPEAKGTLIWMHDVRVGSGRNSILEPTACCLCWFGVNRATRKSLHLGSF